MNVQLFPFGEPIAHVGHQRFLRHAPLLSGHSTQLVLIDGQTRLTLQARRRRGCHRYARRRRLVRTAHFRVFDNRRGARC